MVTKTYLQALNRRRPGRSETSAQSQSLARHSSRASNKTQLPSPWGIRRPRGPRCQSPSAEAFIRAAPLVQVKAKFPVKNPYADTEDSSHTVFLTVIFTANAGMGDRRVRNPPCQSLGESRTFPMSPPERKGSCAVRSSRKDPTRNKIPHCPRTNEDVRGSQMDRPVWRGKIGRAHV